MAIPELNTRLGTYRAYHLAAIILLVLLLTEVFFFAGLGAFAPLSAPALS